MGSRNSQSLKAIERELVFDIDSDDFATDNCIN